MDGEVREVQARTHGRGAQLVGDCEENRETRRQPSQVSNDFPCQLYYEYNIVTYIYIYIYIHTYIYIYIYIFIFY